MPLNYRCSASLTRVACYTLNAAFSTGFALELFCPHLRCLSFSCAYSVVHPKAESVASVGAWTNTGSLCQGLMGRSKETPSTTTPRANRRQPKPREGGSDSKMNCKQMETLRILGERSRDGSSWYMDVCYFYLLPTGPFFWGRVKEQRKSTRRKKCVPVTETHSVLFFAMMEVFLNKLFVFSTRTDAEKRTLLYYQRL